MSDTIDFISSVNDYNLLEKTELWIEGITLNNVNLTEVAKVVATVLCLEEHETFVVDVRDTHITLDILKKTLSSDNFIGKETEIITALSHINGVSMHPDCRIHSHGVLGMISMSQNDAMLAKEGSDKIVVEIRQKIAKRVKIFPTGFEVSKGLISDTNSPMLAESLEKIGYEVKIGDVINDDANDVAYHLIRACEDGYGLVITTGGVGAEDKDHTVEGLLLLDPHAATPWLVKYHKGTGRHVKHGVRIGVGKVGNTVIINLPGPNDEVALGLEIILQQLPNLPDVHRLGDMIADKLRAKMAGL